MKKLIYKNRFFPNNKLIQRWRLFQWPNDYLKCPTLEISSTESLEVLSKEEFLLSNAYLAGSTTTGDEPSIAIIDKSCFNLQGMELNDQGYAEVKLRYGKEIEENCIAKPSRLRLLSPTHNGLVDISANSNDDYFTFSGVTCESNCFVEEDTLLIPPHLFNLFHKSTHFKVVKRLCPE